jgi:micrococcal nuclease
MKAIFYMILLAAGLLFSAPVKIKQPADNNVRLAELVRVIDGDSVVLDVYLGDGMWVRDRHIRLADVHAYEMGTDTGVKERDYLRNLIPDKDAVLVVEMHGRDKYGRLLGVIWCNGVNLNERMIKQPQGGR